MHDSLRMMDDTFVAHVAGHAGIAEDRAREVTEIVLSGLSAYLTSEARGWIADELPPSIAAALRDAEGVSVPVEERLGEPGRGPGRARELVASVCRVLTEQLSDDAIELLRAAVPGAIRSLLGATASELAARSVGSRRYETLATGRPGSHHPISEARDPEPHGDTVAEANPHAASKLSSTRRER
jgi:uncharacterized protein (DUF2267 family)